MIVDGLGNPVTFLLSAGDDHDSTHAIQLLEQVNISGGSSGQSIHFPGPPFLSGDALV